MRLEDDSWCFYTLLKQLSSLLSRESKFADVLCFNDYHRQVARLLIAEKLKAISSDGQVRWKKQGRAKVMVKLLRAHGGCLGARRRRRTW